jgi:4-hydroxy-2-oxoheptanedioate aldolase
VDVEQLIQHVITTCRAAGVVAGLHCSDAEMAVHWAGRGARLLTVGHDTSLLRAAAAQQWSTLEGAAGVAARRGAGEDSRPDGGVD